MAAINHGGAFPSIHRGHGPLLHSFLSVRSVVSHVRKALADPRRQAHA